MKMNPIDDRRPEHVEGQHERPTPQLASEPSGKLRTFQPCKHGSILPRLLCLQAAKPGYRPQRLTFLLSWYIEEGSAADACIDRMTARMDFEIRSYAVPLDQR